MTLTLNWVNIYLNKSNTDNNKEILSYDFYVKGKTWIVCEGKLALEQVFQNHNEVNF